MNQRIFTGEVRAGICAATQRARTAHDSMQARRGARYSRRHAYARTGSGKNARNKA